MENSPDKPKTVAKPFRSGCGRPVAAIQPGAEQVGPARGVLRDVRERPPVDDPLAVDVGDALAERVARAERLDDVAGEVEARGNVPTRWERAGARNVALASAAKHHDSAP